MTLFSHLYAFILKCSNKMTCRSAKCYSTAIYTTVLVVLSLQLLGTIEKQVFDFLGYMWAPIIGNFFQIICTILGIFGTYQYRPKFIVVYSTWSLIWLGWNIFVICLYLEVGVLNRNRDIHILNIGTKSKSWWLEHGIGCHINNDSWLDMVQVDNDRIIPPEEFIEGCLLAYYYVEVIHAAVQCLLALTGFVSTCMAIYIFTEEQETSKYCMPTRTYVSPYDYPSAKYAPIDSVQRVRDSTCVPTYVTYNECMSWVNMADDKTYFLDGEIKCDMNQEGTCFNDHKTVSSGDLSSVPKAINASDCNQMCKRMRYSENGNIVNHTMSSSRASNSGIQKACNMSGEGWYGKVSPV